GRKIFRRDAMTTPPTSAPATAPGPARPARPVHTDTRVLPEGVVWHRPEREALTAEVGPDGKMNLSQVAFDRAGAASPFGDSVPFPLPPTSLTYQHPTTEE